MTAISEYKTRIDEIQKRLNGSNDHGGDQIDELKQRLSAVRASLLRKREIIENQKREIADLRDENAQLSEMLGQALSALDEQSRSGLQTIVQSFDAEFSGLLSDGAPEAAVAEDIEPEPEAAAVANEAGADGDDRLEPPPSDGEQEPEPEPEPEIELESELPALRRIMGRRRR